jgi:transcriptional regulator with XRE-family HTH domain
MKTTLHGDLGRTPRSSFRLFLRAELGRRCARNPRYSLRAFANFLGLDHATLSQLLRGKRRLTERTIRTLGAKLGLDRDAIDAHVAREPFDAGGGTLDAGRADSRRVTSDIVRLVSEWEHYAILELVRLKDFRPDVNWIARVLDLHPDRVTLAIDRLVRLGLLVMETRHRWVDTSGDAVADLSELTQEAIRRFASQSRSRWPEPPPAGPQGGSATTVAVHSARLPGALGRIARFRRELLEYLQGDPVRDQVYAFEIQLFPLTNLQTQE